MDLCNRAFGGIAGCDSQSEFAKKSFDNKISQNIFRLVSQKHTAECKVVVDGLLAALISC